MEKKKLRIIVGSCMILLPLLLAIAQVFMFYPRGFLINSDDMHFHLTRILGLAQALQNGTWPFFINNAFLRGFGYASNWFYPDLFILPMSFLLNLGVHLIHFVKSYYIVLSLATFIMTYFCTKSITHNRSISYLSAIMYTFCNYRAADLYWRFALGESIAFLFLPLVFLGCYEIFIRDEKKWYLLTLGFSGMLYSHLLSTLLCFIMVIIIGLLSYKKLIKDRSRLIYLVLAGVITLFIGSFQIFPMLEQLSSNTFKLTTFAFRTPAEQSFSIKQLISSILLLGPFSPNIKEANYGLGFVFVIALVFRIFIKRKDDQNIKFGDNLAFVSLMLVVLTTSLFPWNYFHLLDLIQFPWRLNLFSSFFLSVASSIYIIAFIGKSSKVHQVSIIPMFVALIIFNNGILANNFFTTNINEWSFFTSDRTTVEQIWVLNVGGGKEYLPDIVNYGIIIEQKNEISLSNDAKMTIDSYEDDRSKISLRFSDLSKTTKIIFPRIWYLGYQTYLDGIKIPNNMSDNGLVEVELNATQQNGSLVLLYEATSIQKYSLIISIASLLIFTIFIIYQNKQTSRNITI